MKYLFVYIPLFFLCSSLASAQIILNGTLEEDARIPVPETRINVAGGPSDITDSKGKFSIKLSRDFIVGERVILVIIKKGWIINHPLDGEWNLPKYQNVHTTRVIIVPKGSKKLWTHERIEKHIALLSDELAKLKKEGDKPKPIDFTYYLSQWATKYGFTADEVKEEFDSWAKQAEGSEDKRERCLSNFYQKKFELASICFEESAIEKRKLRKQRQEELRQLTLSEYDDWKKSGNTDEIIYQFEKALTKYEEAQSLVQREFFPKEWAEIGLLVGNAKLEIGIRTEGRKGNRFLEEAKQAYHQALEVRTREDLPQQWATTQNNLGVALSNQGIRTGGEAGTRLLAQSVEAFRKALEVRTREDLPQDWAATQNNLGNALSDQGIRTGGEAGTRLLAQSVEAYRKALEVRTREDLPQDWAATQNNLGAALRNQGTRTGGETGTRLLAQSVEAFRKALEVRTREDLPQQWAMTQNNLGNTLHRLGEWEKSTEYLRQSKIAIQSAYSVYKKAGYTQYDNYFKEKLRQLEQLIEQQQHQDLKR